MNRSRFDELARKKQALVMKAAQERADITAACRKIQFSLGLKHAVLGLGRTLKAHPMITAGASSFVVSGLAGKLVKGAAQAIALSRVALPLWTWLKRRKP